MEVHFDKLKFPVTRAIVTVGTFDGVHRGHQYVISQLKEIAQTQKGETVVISFEPHPQHIVAESQPRMPLLNTLTEKIHRFEQLGIDHLLILSFTKELANLSYQDFFEEILLSKIHINKLLVGYDHRFGKNREGNYDALSSLCKKHSIEIIRTKQIEVEENHVSSSAIRKHLKEGNISLATELLSYPYSVSGKVIHGDKIGRTIGFPTANIAKNNPHKLTPKTGVYAVNIICEGKTYNGMLNIGTRPSVSSRNIKKIEVHIFHFNENIYDKNIKIIFQKYIREECKFENIEKLKTQLEQDFININNFFKK